jgi:hypothetical protein
MVTLAPMASPAAMPGWWRPEAKMAVTISSGSAPASTNPTARAVTPKRRPAAAAYSAKSSEPAVNRTAENASRRKPTAPRR